MSVTTPYGTGSRPGFTWLPLPTITSFTPTSGGTGTVIAISGTNLTGATAVSFGGVAATSFTVVSAELINAVVNTGASGKVSVTTSFGTAEKAGFTYIAAPVITSFTPASGETGTTITITGSNLNSVNGVQFGGEAASAFTIVNSTTIRAFVGTGASGNITVLSPYGNSSLPGFTYVSRPIITSFTPTSGPMGGTVTITGKYFSDATEVYFSGVEAESFTIVNDNTIIAVTGLGNSGGITIINPIGSGFSTDDYTFLYPAPTFSSFTPATGAQGAQVTITGTNFIPGRTSVSFGNVHASVVVNSPTSITATIGAGASGDVTISTPGGHASLPGFVFIKPPPLIESVVPFNAVKGVAVEIYGKRFTGATAVSFGGVPASSFTINDDTYITAIVGAGATGDVAVTTADGTGTVAGFGYGPIITSFSPTSGGPGTVVEITGTGFVNVANLYFGPELAKFFVVNSSTSITATVGAGSSGFVSIITFGRVNGHKDGFTFISPNTIINSVTPAVGSAGSTVTIIGSGFSGATAVSFGGVAASSFTVNSPDSITATLGGGATGDVIVNSPSGADTLAGFVYSTAPIITGFSPGAAMAGATITISGSNFIPLTSGNIVYFGGIKARVTAAAANSLTVEVPTGAPYDYISVTKNGLTAYSQKKFNKLFLATGTLDINSFETKIDSASGPSPKNVTTADFDLDGKADVVVCHSGNSIGTNFITVYKNNGTSLTISFLPKQTIPDPQGAGPLNSVTGDLDGDGKLDLIVGDAYDGHHVSVFKNTSTGNAISFGDEIPLIGHGLDANYVACTDIDMDGKPDIICVAAYGAQSAAILRNTSSGGTLSFVKHLIPAGAFPQGVTVADLDMDGKPDLIFPSGDNFYTNSASIVRNISTPGNIAFEPRISVSTGTYPRGVVVGDIDGDGRNDIIISADITNTLSVIRNLSAPGTIVMDNKKDLLSFTAPHGMAIGDINGDGKPEVLSATTGGSKISLYPNNSSPGNISFGEKIDIQTGSKPRSISIADLDSDQRPDIVVANTESGTVSFIRNKISAVSLTSISPVTGIAGTVVTVKGMNLSSASAVSIGGVAAASFTVVDAETITAVVAAGATGSVSVTTSYGMVMLGGFTYIGVPAITSFTPDTAGTGMQVTIRGRNFTGTTAVLFGGVTGTFSVLNDTTITAFVATGATGIVSVTTPGGTATLGGFVFGNKVTGVIDPSNANSKELTANPNPSHDILIINHPASVKNARLRFIDVLGRDVKTVIPIRNSSKTETLYGDRKSVV